MKKVLAILGSTKKNSSNQAILNAVIKSYKETIEIDLFNTIDLLPHFNPDLDTDNPPEQIIDLRQRIKVADGVLICTPEYVFSLPGALKNALEWNVSSTLFLNKPTAFIVAASSGEKAFESLNLILKTIEANVSTQSTLLIKGAKGKVGINGNIQDENLAKKIDNLMISLLNSIDENKAIKDLMKFV